MEAVDQLIEQHVLREEKRSEIENYLEIHLGKNIVVPMALKEFGPPDINTSVCIQEKFIIILNFVELL